jgi:C1q domain
MSQFIKLGLNAAPGTYVAALEGNTGGAVGPTIGGLIYVVGDGVNITSDGDPGDNTITWALTGFTQYATVVGNSSGGLTSLAAATDGQLPIGSTGANPVIATLTAGSGISITNGAGSITIASSGSGGLSTLTGDTGTATESGGNINVTGGGLLAGYSGAVFTGSSDNLELTFNYLSLPNTTSKDYGTVYFGGSSNTVLHNYQGAFFGVNVGLNNGGNPVTNCIGIGNYILQKLTGNINTVSEVIGIGTNIFYYIGSGNNLIGIGSNISAGFGGSEQNSYIIAIGDTLFSAPGTTGISNLIAIGYNHGNGYVSATNDIIMIGNSCLNLISSGSENIGIGTSCLTNALYGSYNVALGFQAGINCNVSSEFGGNNSNIYLQNPGVSNDNNVMRLGATGSGIAQVSSTYIGGINGVTVSNQLMVVMDSATEQLGTASMSSGGIQTINVDNSGSVTGSTIDLYANSGSANAGSSVAFIAASGTEIDLQVTDSNGNTNIGALAGNAATTGVTTLGYASGTGTGSSCCYVGYGISGGSGSNNTQMGYAAASVITTGADNVIIGCVAFEQGNGSQNVIIGSQANDQANGGNDNVIIGFSAGNSYNFSESNNILLNNPGVTSESNVLHIGSGTGSGSQQLANAYISGINSNTVYGALVNISSSDQLAVTSLTSDASGRTTNANQPAFLAYLVNTISNVTGDGTIYTILFDTVSLNQGGYFDSGSSTFTAPVTGVYQFNLSVVVSGLTVAYTTGQMYIYLNGSNSVNLAYINPGAAAAAGGYLQMTASITLPLAATTTVNFATSITGSTPTVNVFGASSIWTFASGYLVC